MTTASAFLPVSPLAAQQTAITVDDLLKIIDNPSAVEQVLEEMDALWSIMALGETRKRGILPPPSARASYNEVRAQIANPDLRNSIASALQSQEAKTPLSQLGSSLARVLKQLAVVLVERGFANPAP